MDKISSILPSNARVQSVDLKDAHPIRPGAPSFGQPIGSTSSVRDRDRISISNEAKELAFKDTLAGRNPREEKGAQIASEVTRRFFETRLDPIKEVHATPMSEDIQESIAHTTEMAPLTSKVLVKEPAVSVGPVRPVSTYEFQEQA